MVVDVLEVRHHRRVDRLQVAAQHRVDDLAHRQHDPAQPHERLAQLERPLLHLLVARHVVEESIFERLDLGVQQLDRVEVAVDDHVEQAPEQETGAVGREVAIVAPALHDRGHIEVRLVHGDEGVRRDERLDLGRAQRARHRVESDGVRGEEEVGVVAIQLGALEVVQGILHREPVQAELLFDGGQICFARRGEVGPDGGALFVDTVRNIVDREVLFHNLSGTIQPCGHHSDNASRDACW